MAGLDSNFGMSLGATGESINFLGDLSDISQVIILNFTRKTSSTYIARICVKLLLLKTKDK